MTLYILYDYFSPAYKAGGPIQSIINMVEYLNEDVSTKIICSNRDIDGTVLAVKADQLIRHKQNEVYYSSKGFQSYKKVVRAGEKNVIFINGIYSLHYNFLAALLLKGRKIISVRGMLHEHALAQKPLKKRIYLIVWRLLALHKKCEYHATSEAEQRYIYKQFGRNTKVWVVSNLPKILPYQKPELKHEGELVITTVALISPMKNHHLILEALLHSELNITYNIYGTVKDPKYWQVCLTLIKRLPSNISVVYHGHRTAEEIPAIMAGTHVYVQPSESENFGHSIFEALSTGRPVITSHRTPWDQLDTSGAGNNVSTEQPEELKNALSWYARMDSQVFEEQSKKAREYALRAIDIHKIKNQYLDMFGVK